MTVPPPATGPAPDGQQVPPLAGAFGPPVPPPAPEQPKKKGIGRKILSFVVLIVVATAVKFGISYFFNAPVHAEAGDCVRVTGSENSPDVETKECGDKDANYKVVKVVDDTFDLNACANVSDTALAQQWDREKFVLCLTSIS
ncbi:hypothetical protein ACFW9F_06050 [Streptomyces sp. NPDC059506]|uniref:LppU/SCO3897 family protein n=1 Tax=Streptomyces TaxID=1883 RepID=UPI000CBDC912|nr:hypothetical protein [Streptomyces sp. SCUT-3]PLW71328.1 hypothetical protein C0036_18420 [Streptomyces sp. DJ]QMV22687.1 hypothetical protein GQS52_13915 [Streptomyces sp. SCUT-3]